MGTGHTVEREDLSALSEYSFHTSGAGGLSRRRSGGPPSPEVKGEVVGHGGE